MFLRLSGEYSETPQPIAETTAEKPLKTPDPKHADVLSAPPLPEKKENEPAKQPEPEVKIIEKTIEKTIEVEKPIEVISLPNAVKLFMFDKRLDQDSITIKNSTVNLESDSEKNAKGLETDLKKYLTENNLTITSEKPLKVKDTHGEYTLTFSVKPKPAPKKEPVATKKEPVKKQDKPVVRKEPVKPAVKYTAKMALVIDDCGYSVPLAHKLASLKYPVTFAVIPYTPYGRETAKIAKDSGNTLFIHYPMQPKSYPEFDPGKGAIFLNMPEALIASITRANMQYFGMTLDGANNHTGSAFTESEEKMTEALTYIKQYTPRFLDSYTSGSSKAFSACRKLGMKCAVNSTFLDNEEPGLVTGSDKQNHVHGQLVAAAKKALSNGSTIAIGHLRNDTVAALPYSLAEIEKMGVKIVPVTDLMY